MVLPNIHGRGCGNLEAEFTVPILRDVNHIAGQGRPLVDWLLPVQAAGS